MRHLTRVGQILAAIVVVFALLKLMPMPASLQSYGFYKGEDNRDEWASLPVQYVESSRCSQCHQAKYESLIQGRHSTVSCETCHGPGTAHIETLAKPEVDGSRQLCGLCHDQLLARPGNFPQVDLSGHGGQAACFTCHDPHGTQVAAPPRIPHAVAADTNCLQCHDTGLSANHAGRASDTCLTCHQNG